MCKARSTVTLIIALYLSASRSSAPKIKVRRPVKAHQTMAAVPSRDKAFAVSGGITGMSARDSAPGVAPAG